MSSSLATTSTRADLGDLTAFARVYRDTAGPVRRALARLGVHEAALDDATQDVFIVAYRHRDDFDPERPIVPWLLGIARRVASRYRRSNARGQRKLAALRLVPDPPSEQLAAHVEARRFLGQFLEELRDERREVFVLGELYGLTGPEIAARLQIPVDTAYTRLRAGRRQLELALLRDADADHAEPANHTDHAVLQRGWLLLAPQLGGAPGGGWILLALGKAKLALGAATVIAGVTIAAVVMPRLADRPATMAPIVEPTTAIVSTKPASVVPAAPVVPVVPVMSAAPVVPTTATPSRATRSPAIKAEPDPLGATRLAAALTRLQAGDAAGALAETETHAREHPNSPLTEARTLTRVRALCALGQVQQARADASTLNVQGPAGAALATTCAAR